MLKQQGLTMDGIKKRIREQILVQRVTRRKVALRISVTEQEIDGYISANRAKLETGLTFEARHILFVPEPAKGEDGWGAARQKAEQVYGLVVAGRTSRSSRKNTRRIPRARTAGASARSSAVS